MNRVVHNLTKTDLRYFELMIKIIRGKLESGHLTPLVHFLYPNFHSDPIIGTEQKGTENVLTACRAHFWVALYGFCTFVSCFQLFLNWKSIKRQLELRPWLQWRFWGFHWLRCGTRKHAARELVKILGFWLDTLWDTQTCTRISTADPFMCNLYVN